MRVKEWQGDVVFLHEVAPGTADRSYGIHVAKLAGLPEAVTARAEEVLESSKRASRPARSPASPTTCRCSARARRRPSRPPRTSPPPRRCSATSAPTS